MLVDATRRNNYDPHPDRLRFASAVDPPHKGEGKLGLEPSCKTTECLASRRFHFIGISSYSRARSSRANPRARALVPTALPEDATKRGLGGIAAGPAEAFHGSIIDRVRAGKQLAAEESDHRHRRLLLEPSPHDAKLYAPPRVSASL